MDDIMKKQFYKMVCQFWWTIEDCYDKINRNGKLGSEYWYPSASWEDLLYDCGDEI